MTIYKVNDFDGKIRYFDSSSNPNAQSEAQALLLQKQEDILIKEAARFSICATFVESNNTTWREIKDTDPEDTICQVFDTFTGVYTQVPNKTEAFALNEQKKQNFLAAIRLDKVYLASEEEFLIANIVYGDAVYTPTIEQPGKDCSWAPTPYLNVYKMLEMLNLTPNDTLYDLGSGDGNILIKAVKKYGCSAVGVEYNNDLVELSKRNAEKEGLLDKITFVNEDLLNYDFSNATAVTLYLTDEINEQLKFKLKNLSAGSRVVSCGPSITGWAPEKVDENNSLFMWRVL